MDNKMPGKGMLWAVFMVLLCIQAVVGVVKEVLSNPEYTFCIQNVERSRGNFSAGIKGSEELADWYCIEKMLWRTDHTRGAMARLTDEQKRWITSLFEQIEIDYQQSVASFNTRPNDRVRQEYRTLTAEKRRNFVEAVQFLKSDTSVLPNKYDVFVLLYNGIISASARYGPGFFGYHRILILLFETALRQVIPGIVVPYWDSTIDGRLKDPRQSTFWSEDIMGTAEGPVLTGPFQNWQTVDGSHLIRNVGTGGHLLTSLSIAKMCFKSRLQEITEPGAPSSSIFERTQGDVHLFVGGEMRDIWSSPNDPLFFLHYAFVDCIWEQFREHQTRKSINPETDYPVFYGTSAHAPNSPVLLDFMITNEDALKDKYGKRLYRCAPRPRCMDNLSCGSESLRCNFNTLDCEPKIRTLDNSCPNHGTLGRKGYQNSYCANGICNTDQWVYLPIQVVYGRSPDFPIYNSHPYESGQPNFNQDIYDPKFYSDSLFFSARVNRQLDTAEFTECGCKTRGINHGGVYIQSHGINYQGSYREYSVVDRRLPVSSSMGVVAVKKPVAGDSYAFIRAYDDCGRICRPVCHMPNSDWYETCTAVVKLSAIPPLEYSETYEGVFLQTWDFSRGPFIPVFNPDNVRLIFYCDFSGAWPWMFYEPAPPMSLTTTPPSFLGSDGSKNPVQNTPAATTTTPRPTTTQRILRQSARPTTRPPPPTTTTTTTTTTIATTTTTPVPTTTTPPVPTTTTTPVPTTTVFVEPDCFLEDFCYKGKKETNCFKCVNNELVPCVRTCKKFLQCSQGYLTIMDCGRGLSWDSVSRNCVFFFQNPNCPPNTIPRKGPFKAA